MRHVARFVGETGPAFSKRLGAVDEEGVPVQRNCNAKIPCSYDSCNVSRS